MSPDRIVTVVCLCAAVFLLALLLVERLAGGGPL